MFGKSMWIVQESDSREQKEHKQSKPSCRNDNFFHTFGDRVHNCEELLNKPSL
jgi:hypothetical protein